MKKREIHTFSNSSKSRSASGESKRCLLIARTRSTSKRWVVAPMGVGSSIADASLRVADSPVSSNKARERTVPFWRDIRARRADIGEDCIGVVGELSKGEGLELSDMVTMRGWAQKSELYQSPSSLF